MGFWENEYPEATLSVHHLMVLSYYLQHPNLYSPEGLNEAEKLLIEFVERGTTTLEIRKRNRERLDSGNRKFKIKGTSDARGSYDPPVRWTMTVGDVVAGGIDNYDSSIKAWAQSIYDALKESGNLVMSR